MISLKKYLEQAANASAKSSRESAEELLPLVFAAYRSALEEMGNSGREACPALGQELQQNLQQIRQCLEQELPAATLEAVQQKVRAQLRDWGAQTAKHLQARTDEIKELLLVMAHTTEAVGERDQCCAQQLNQVTAQLQRIASLEDLTQIRTSIKRSAQELKTSVEKMATEGRAAMEKAKAEISTYQTKLEEAEQIASRDSLTGLRNRMSTESLIERRIQSGCNFCLALLDMNGFKHVNDQHGHLVGDELLKQFGTELRSACRSTDLIGRWGGDEFVIVLECGYEQAQAQLARVREWCCGDYTLPTPQGAVKLTISSAIGLTEYQAGESVKEIIARADAAMYKDKAKMRR